MRLHLLALLSLAAVLVTAGTDAVNAAVSPLRARDLRCEYQTSPLGIDVARPRLFWVLDSSQRAQKQTAYQILVASSEAALRRNQGDVWDSGRVQSDQSTHIVYGGPPLRSRQQCFWKVRVWDRNGNASAWSAPARWEMGLLNEADWKAQWISFPTQGPRRLVLEEATWIWHPEGNGVNAPKGVRFFRREFTLPPDAKIRRAETRIAADDNAKVFLNGQEFAQVNGWQNTPARTVTVHVRPGRNVLAAQVTNGSDGPSGLLLRLEVELSSGETVAINTDETWKSSQTEAAGWQTPEFNGGAWVTARQVAKAGEGPWGAIRTPAEPGPVPHLRREFTLRKPIRKARLYATALGVYEAHLNGRRIGDTYFSPSWTDYHRRVQYQAYDVTPLVKQGENALGLLLGDGWYAGFVAHYPRNFYGQHPFALAQLEVEYTDGTSETLGTDRTWKAATGAIRFSDMLQGETYDAREELNGWTTTGYTDETWKPVQLKQPEPKPALVAQVDPPIRKTQELRPKKITQPLPNTYVFDLGQNMVGWVRLKARGPAGTTITLRFAEMLNPDGTLYTTNLRSARATDQYVLKGQGTEVFEPHFTFHGFQYVEVTGYPGEPSPDAITGVVVHSDTPPTGEFACSNPMVNQLQSNIRWGQRGNFLAVPTDCPQRDERMGWTGDAQIFVRTATFNMDVAPFFTKWLRDVRDAQFPNGAFPDVAPRLAMGGGTAAWGDAGVICPWTIYLAYGDKRIIEENYDAMTRWIDYLKANSKDLIRPAAGYGDWLSIQADTPKDLLATAYFAYSTRLLSRMAGIIGKTDDARKYEDLFQQIKTAFNRAFVQPDGKLKGETQTAYLVALRFDLLPENLREAAAKHLVADIRKRNTHLSTGFVGVGYLLPTLTDAGYTDVAYQLLNNDTFPSWGYSIKYGATTIWERWNGWTKENGFFDPSMNSFNHYSLGSVGEWMYATVTGIAPDPNRPGYRHSIIRPRPGGGLTWAKGSYRSVHGLIATDWKLDGGQFALDVTIPANTTATVYVPTTDAKSVREGRKAADQAEGVRLLRTEDGYAVYEVGSGRYRFRAPFATEPASTRTSAAF